MSRPGPAPDHPTMSPPAPSAATLRLIVTALTLAALGGVAGAAFVRGGDGHWANGQDALLLPGIVVLLAMSEVMAFFMVRMTVLRTARATFTPEDRQTAWAPYATLTLIGAAMATGVSVFGVVVFFITAHWLALVPAVICLPVLFALIPTDSRFERFVNTLTGGETR